MKKFIKNILYFIIINSILFICHIWALFGVAFNDTGVQYNSIGGAMHIILFGITPLIVGTIILSKIFKKHKDFSIYQFLILQFLVIVGWAMFYISSYVPNSFINQYIQEKNDEKIIKFQNKINEEAIQELKNGYIIVDVIENENQKMAIYINKNYTKAIIELSIDDNANYIIVDTIKNTDEAKESIRKYNSNYHMQIDKYNQLSIILNSVQYGVYKEAWLEGWYAPSKYIGNIYVGSKGYDPINTYMEMIKDSISKGEKIYYINDNKLLEIKKTDAGVKIDENSIENKKIDQRYSWVIKKNNEIILQRSLKENELIFEKDLTKKMFYGEKGDYEIYIETYDKNMGYCKVSNSIFWSNE